MALDFGLITHLFDQQVHNEKHLLGRQSIKVVRG